MAKAGTPAEIAVSKKKTYVYIPIDLGSGRTGTVTIRGDVAEYFNIAAPAADAGGTGYKVITRKSTGRELYVDLADTTPTASATDANNKYALPKQLSSRGGGKTITIPTELKTAKGNTRTVRISFPSNAGLGAISNFLFNKIVAHKPSYFISQNGVRRAIVNIPTADINAGEDTTAPAA